MNFSPNSTFMYVLAVLVVLFACDLDKVGRLF